MTGDQPQPTGNATLDATIERMLEISRQRQKAVERFLAGEVQSVACPFHGIELRLDPGRSAVASAHAGRHIADYQPCPACERDTEDNAQATRLHGRGVPLNLCRCSLENYVPPSEKERSHLAKVREFCKTRRGFLVLLGAVGTGKSHLAVGCMREFKRPLFIKQATLLRRLRATYTDKAAGDPIELCQGAGLLVLDEIGLSAGGRDELPMLHETLDYRYGEMKPTVLTGNLDWPAMREILGERLSDRMRESAFGVLVFDGPSHRPGNRDGYFQD